MRIGIALHEQSITMKFKMNNQKLIQTCEAALREKKEKEFFWDNNFNLWLPFIGPTRSAAMHQNGVLCIDFEGSPDNESGVCYDPKAKLKLEKNYKHMFGPWYRFDSAHEFS
jgi:hypothetical protein